MRVRFGPFRFDTERRELTSGSERIHLKPKAFQLLEILVAARPKPVSQKMIQDTLWPDTFVDEGSLHSLVHQVRQALGENGHDIIKTEYGFGFAFAADAVDDRPSSSPCFLTIGDHDFVLAEGENIIGREWDAAVRIDAPSISRRHARIVVESGRAMIEDLESKNGTSVAGRRLREKRELSNGDQILFGSVAARFRVLPEAPPTETTPAIRSN